LHFFNTSIFDFCASRSKRLLAAIHNNITMACPQF
jgi:hypothetical protein